MMLANIMNGSIPPDRRKKSDEQRATLIICPSSVADQWFSEIEKHCEQKWTGMVIKYFGNSKADSNNNKELLANAAIV
jgi:SNF2 family DNA or RNA helicase